MLDENNQKTAKTQNPNFQPKSASRDGKVFHRSAPAPMGDHKSMMQGAAQGASLSQFTERLQIEADEPMTRAGYAWMLSTMVVSGAFWVFCIVELIKFFG